MEATNSSNNFLEYINRIFTPSCIVYSTDEVKKLIQKNNIRPAEFLRPFGNFNGYNINFSLGDKYTTNIKNFRIDFYDSDKFKTYNTNHFNEALDLGLAYNSPDWDYRQLNLTNRAFLELFKKRLKNFSTSWFDEYEKIICETLRFSPYEMYQQPLGNIYMASTQDEIETIELLKKKNIPNLLSENIYEPKLASMILLLSDLTEKRLSNDKLINKINLIKNKNPKSYVMFLDINSQDINDIESKLDDIWLPYLHKTDVYNSNFINCDRGKYISLNEREIFRTSIFNFFDIYVKPYLHKLIFDLDEEVSNNKKGIKNGLLSIFKKSEKPEYLNFEGNTIYKGKSQEHLNSVNELINIAKFLNGKRDIEFDSVYSAYKKQNLKNAFRFLMIYIRMLESSRKFNEITKILVKFVNEIPINYITPLLLEKISISHLYASPVNIRKFSLYQALTAIAFRNTKADMKKYVLNNFGNVIKFFLKNSPSFNKIKEYINLTVADICLNSNKFDGGQIFFKNYLELCANKKSDQEQDYIINHYLKCISSANNAHMAKLLYVPLNYFSIPEVTNTSLIVIHEQDQENCNGRNWRNFKQFSKVKERIWANLTENDMNVISNLDNIIEGKQNFTNQHKERVFKCSTNNKIIVKFLIKNPLNLLLNVSKLKLICDFIPKDTSGVLPTAVKYENMNGNAIFQEENEKNNNENEFIKYDEKSVNLDRFQEKLIDLFCIPKKPGQLIIRGLEIGLFKMALFNHSFYEKTPNDLYKQKDNYVKSKPKDIIYDVTDERQDISIKFSNKDINIYKNELFFLKIFIENNSNAKLKRYSVFLDDNDNDLHIKLDTNKNNSSIKRNSKTLNSSTISSHAHFNSYENLNQNHQNFFHEEKPIIGNVSVFKYFHRENDIFKGETNEIAIPLCPQNEGEFKLKILIKFEEESKFKEIEIRRFLLKVKIFTNEFLVKPEEDINWITLANEKYSKLYSKIRLVYKIKEEKDKMEKIALEEKKAKKLSRIISNEKNPFFNINADSQELYLFDFLLFYSNLKNKININNGNPDSIENLFGEINPIEDPIKFYPDINNSNLLNKDNSNSKATLEINQLNLMSLYEITLKFNELLNKKKNIFISYTVKDKHKNYEFQGLNLLSLHINPQSLNYKNIKNIIREISEVKINKEKLNFRSDEENMNLDIEGCNDAYDQVNLTYVNIKIKMRNLFNYLDLNSFEIFINDEDNEFDWFGVRRYKIKMEEGNTNVNNNELINEFDFNFSTYKKGSINVNRFNINIIPSLNTDKVITINNIPHSIIVDLN